MDDMRYQSSFVIIDVPPTVEPTPDQVELNVCTGRPTHWPTPRGSNDGTRTQCQPRIPAGTTAKQQTREPSYGLGRGGCRGRFDHRR